jgi:hypothetical protein
MVYVNLIQGLSAVKIYALDDFRFNHRADRNDAMTTSISPKIVTTGHERNSGNLCNGILTKYTNSFVVQKDLLDEDQEKVLLVYYGVKLGSMMSCERTYSETWSKEDHLFDRPHSRIVPSPILKTFSGSNHVDQTLVLYSYPEANCKVPSASQSLLAASSDFPSAGTYRAHNSLSIGRAIMCSRGSFLARQKLTFHQIIKKGDLSIMKHCIWLQITKSSSQHSGLS